MAIIERFERELAQTLGGDEAAGRLAGYFNRYRPLGAGLERLFGPEGVEGEIHRRLLDLFRASAAGSSPADLYFIVREPPPTTVATRLDLARARLDDLRGLAEFAGDKEAADFLGRCEVVDEGGTPDDDLAALASEGWMDALTGLQRAKNNEVFRLMEAFYSMAADYELAEYVLWPATASYVPLQAPFDSAYELWRHGLRLVFLEGDRVTVQRC